MQEHDDDLALQTRHAVQLPVPVDDGKAFAVRHRRDLVRGLSTKRDQHPSLTNHAKLRARAQIGKHQRTATMRTGLWRVRLGAQKNHSRNEPAFSVEQHHSGVAVLMRHKEITLAIMEKLRVFALAQHNIKML